MKTEIEEIISKNLPAQVGDVLKQRLTQADALENEVKQLREYKISHEATIKGLRAEIDKYIAFDNRNSALDAREKELAQRELNLGLEILKYQLASEKEKTEFTKTVALGLVRNTEYRKTIFDSEAQAPFVDANGNWQYPQPTSKNHEETNTKS